MRRGGAGGKREAVNHKTALLAASMLPVSLILDGDRFERARRFKEVPDLLYEQRNLTHQHEIKAAAQRKRERRAARNLKGAE